MQDNMKEKFRKFMIGRYGVDDLSRFLLCVLLVLCITNFFLRNSLLNLLITAGMIYLYFRMFSKNYSKRYQENQWFLTRKNESLNFFRRQKSLTEQRKKFRIYTCPSCRQKIRIPKGHGKVQVTCPKCRTEFIKRS